MATSVAKNQGRRRVCKRLITIYCCCEVQLGVYKHTEVTLTFDTCIIEYIDRHRVREVARRRQDEGAGVCQGDPDGYWIEIVKRGQDGKF